MAQVIGEAERLKIDVSGLAEVRWTGIGECQANGWTFYYSGEKQRMYGVGLLVSTKAANAITAVTPVNERIIHLRIEAKPKAINTIQVYFPTSDADETI